MTMITKSRMLKSGPVRSGLDRSAVCGPGDQKKIAKNSLGVYEQRIRFPGKGLRHRSGGHSSLNGPLMTPQ